MLNDGVDVCSGEGDEFLSVGNLGLYIAKHGDGALAIDPVDACPATRLIDVGHIGQWDLAAARAGDGELLQVIGAQTIGRAQAQVDLKGFRTDRKFIDLYALKGGANLPRYHAGIDP